MMLTEEGRNQVRHWMDVIKTEAPDEIKDAPMTPHGTAAVAQWLRENGHAEGYPPLAVDLIFAAAVFDAAEIGHVSWDEVLEAMLDA